MTSPKTGTDFAVRLAHARQLASRFSRATDALNAALADVEKALAELQLGVSARVLIKRDDGRDNGCPYSSYLIFCKTGKAWRLLVESGPDDDYANETSSPVCETSREIRLLAAKHLPELLEKLIGTAEEELRDVEANAHAVRNLVQTIRSGGNGLTELGADVTTGERSGRMTHGGGESHKDLDAILKAIAAQYEPTPTVVSGLGVLSPEVVSVKGRPVVVRGEVVLRGGKVTK